MLNGTPVRSTVHHFTWILLENMTDRFSHIPDFAWISHALPLKAARGVYGGHLQQA